MFKTIWLFAALLNSAAGFVRTNLLTMASAVFGEDMAVKTYSDDPASWPLPPAAPRCTCRRPCVKIMPWAADDVGHRCFPCAEVLGTPCYCMCEGCDPGGDSEVETAPHIGATDPVEASTTSLGSHSVQAATVAAANASAHSVEVATAPAVACRGLLDDVDVSALELEDKEKLKALDAHLNARFSSQRLSQKQNRIGMSNTYQ